MKPNSKPTTLIATPEIYEKARRIMGYRSDVAYTIRAKHDSHQKAVQTFFTFLAEAKSKDEYKLALNEVAIDEKNLTINFSCENMKWYPSFVHVQSHMALWNLAQEYGELEDPPLHGRFIEVGEELDDTKIESFGNVGYDWVYVERKILRDW